MPKLAFSLAACAARMLRTRSQEFLMAATISVLAVFTQMPLLGGNSHYTVAYPSFAPLNSAVIIADADGHNARVLVANFALDSNPSFSPDGRWVLFTSPRDGSAEIYRVRTDGKGLTRLTNHPAFDDQAVMASDGNRVAFVSSRSGQADIWTLDLRTKTSAI